MFSVILNQSVADNFHYSFQLLYVRSSRREGHKGFRYDEAILYSWSVDSLRLSISYQQLAYLKAMAMVRTLRHTTLLITSFLIFGRLSPVMAGLMLTLISLVSKACLVLLVYQIDLNCFHRSHARLHQCISVQPPDPTGLTRLFF
jgi:hypothetical protein